MVGFPIPMLPLKAHVQNGQIVLDEPADLPEGAALESSNETESTHSSPITDAMNAALAQLTAEEVESDLRIVRAAARATMRRNPW